MYNRTAETERLSRILIESRKKGGRSQEDMARAMHVSRKTVQNWESGVSCPSYIAVKEWFMACGVQEFNYLLKLVYSDMEAVGDTDKNTDRALMTVIMSLPSEAKRKLLFALYGNHGSSPLGILELVTAHLHTPLRERINVALIVSSGYKLAQLSGQIVAPESVRPDVELLDYAINQGMEACVKGKNCYTATVGEQEVSL